MDYKTKVELSTEYILDKLKGVDNIEIALILGSGLGVWQMKY